MNYRLLKKIKGPLPFDVFPSILHVCARYCNALFALDVMIDFDKAGHQHNDQILIPLVQVSPYLYSLVATILAHNEFYELARGAI